MTSSSPRGANSDRWRRIEELCDGALRLEPAERAAYLAAECPDEDLRREVEALLAHEHSAERFLGAPVGAVAARVLAATPERDLVGQQLGDYDIVARLGAGGMGVVYRAKDRRLGREVAVKVLPAVVEDDQPRLARFEREARLLATVNHPHIGAIYGLVEADGMRALVLELIEGETLAAALGRGRLPVERTLALAAQIADALDHAHRRGVTHRDLKPSNIMLTPGGVKLLDFGVGKWAPRVGEAPLPGFSTVTQEGMIVGTIHYMAPEQLEGRAADARSDLFSFGAVLYEMLAGRKAFDGPSQASIIAAILEAPRPRLPGVGGALSPWFDRVVGKCLAKDPDHRWQSARDLGDELKWIADEVAHPPAPAAGAAAMPTTSTRRRSVAKPAFTVAGALTLALAGWTAWTRWPAPSGAATTGALIRFVVLPPPSVRVLLDDFDISPDGSQLVYSGREGTYGSRLYMRRLDRFETTPLPATDRATNPVFSPDGEWVAFVGNGTLNRVRASGESSSTWVLAEAPGDVSYVTWPTGDTLFFATPQKGIQRVFAGGGQPTLVTSVRTDTEVDHHSPQLLPGGEALLFAVHGKGDRFSIAVQSLKSGERKPLIESGFAPQYSSTGHLVFALGNAVLAVPFDANRLEVTGPPVTLVQQVKTSPRDGIGAFHLRSGGILVYEPQPSPAGRVLTWVDRAGNETPLPVAARAFNTPRVSPDGRRVAFDARTDGDRRDIWTYEIASDRLTRVTQEGDNWGPLWTRDGSALVYATDREGVTQVVLWRLDGSAPVALGSSPNEVYPAAFAADQKTLLLNERPPNDAFFVSRLSPDTGGHPETLIQGGVADETLKYGFAGPRSARVSPDGRWVAYTNDISRRTEVLIQSFPVAGARLQVTVDGGREPVWRHDGKELFYRSGGRMFAVSIDTTRGLSWGKPRLLFDRDHVVTYLDYDVAPDGRFLMIKPAPEEGSPGQFIVVLNWAGELMSRVPVRR